MLCVQATKSSPSRQRRYRERLRAGRKVCALEYDGRHVSLLIEYGCLSADEARRIAAGELDAESYDAAIARAFKQFFTLIIEKEFLP